MNLPKSRLVLALLTAMLVAGLLNITIAPAAAAAAGEQSIKVEIDNKLLAFDVSPFIEKGRVLVPARALFEALGASVEWNGKSKTVTAEKGDTVVKLTVGSKIASITQRGVTQVILEAPVEIVNGRTMVPLRIISEAFGARVVWDAKSRLVSIVTEGREAVEKEVLSLGFVGRLEPLNILSNDTWCRVNAIGLTHVGLVKFDENMNIIPCLAEKWEVLEDGKAIRFYLAKNAKWHDGKPVTSEDVKFDFEYKKKHRDKIANLDATLVRQHCDRVDVIDDHVLVMRFKKPAVRIALMDLPNQYIIPKHIWEKVDDPRAFLSPENMIGNGPFIFDKYDQAAGVVYFRQNIEYFQAMPTIKRIAYKQYGSIDAMVMALKKGEIDATFSYAKPVPSYLAPSLADTKMLELGMTDDCGIFMNLIFNCRNELFKEKSFREAVSYAINYEQLIRMFASNYGEIPSRGFVPPMVPGSGPSIPKLEFDQEKAKRLLNDLDLIDRNGDGIRELPDGRKVSFSITPEAYPGKEYLIRAVEVICSMLRDVGIDAYVDREVIGNIEKLNERLWRAKDYWAYVGYCTPGGVLSDGGFNYLEGQTYGTFDDPKYIELYNSLVNVKSFEESLEALKQLQNYHAEVLPGIALIWSKVLYPYRTDKFAGWTIQKGWGPVNYKTWFNLRSLTTSDSE